MAHLILMMCLMFQDEKKSDQDTKKDSKEEKQDPKKQDMQDKIEDLEDRVKDLEKSNEELKKKMAATTSANPLTVLNPQVIVVSNMVARHDDRKVFVNNDASQPRIDDTINLKEGEIDFIAAVDPYVNAFAVFSIFSDVPGTYNVDIEEFYGTIKSLPIPLWEKPPLGTQIKIGRMRVDFGLNNKSHSDDIPQVDRPVVIQEFFSPDGWNTNGIETTSFLPSPGDTALQLSLAVLQGGGIGVAQERDHICYMANLNFFWPIADEHSLNLALLGLHSPEGGGMADDTFSVEVLYKWRPLKGGEYKSFLLGGQLFTSKHEFSDAFNPVLIDDTHPFGYSVFAQYQLSARIYAGLRWDDTAFLADDSQRKRQIAPYLTWYSSEFFRVRLQYEHTWSDNALGSVTNGLNTVLLQVVIVFGSHPAEPFWVNK